MWASPLPAKKPGSLCLVGSLRTPAGVRDQDGTLSAISVEPCPPSQRNAVRHQSGTVSGIAWNTHAGGLTVLHLRDQVLRAVEMINGARDLLLAKRAVGAGRTVTREALEIAEAPLSTLLA